MGAFIEKRNNYMNYVNLYKCICIQNDELLSCNKTKDYNLPTTRWLINHCPDKSVNTYVDFVRWCGFIPRIGVTKEECDRAILYMVEKYGKDIGYDHFRSPKLNEVSINIVNKYYGTMNDMKKSFGLPINQESMVDRMQTKQQMLDNLKKLTEEIGRTPRCNDVNDCVYCLGSRSYMKHFGSVENALSLIGLKAIKTNKTRNLSDEEFKNKFIDFIDNLGFVPTCNFCANSKDCPSPITALRRFDCTWLEFLEMIGFKSDKKAFASRCFAIDGELCYSEAEMDIHNIMVLNGLQFDKEILYRDFLCDDNLKVESGLIRCDWVVYHNNKKYVMEYFGMFGLPTYNKKVEFKTLLIERDTNKDYEFIALYPNDDIIEIFKQLDFM